MMIANERKCNGGGLFDRFPAEARPTVGRLAEGGEIGWRSEGIVEPRI